MSGLPSYLTSGASSRAHHAFLAKLHPARQAPFARVYEGSASAGSIGDGRDEDAQNEEAIVQEEVESCLKVLVQRGTSNRIIAEMLIILLHTTLATEFIPDAIAMRPEQHKGPRTGKGKERAHVSSPSGGRADGARQAVERRGDVALVFALQLATASKVLYEKRIANASPTLSTDIELMSLGYLYLAERLPKEHELNLMFINTIRKDLSSRLIPVMTLALHAIIKAPSPELAPAVVPLLSSKALLRHREPMIRQKAIQALLALHFPSSAAWSRGSVRAEFPLSMGKITRMLDKESDPSVARVLISLIQRMVSHNSHRIASLEERAYLIDLVMLSAYDPESQDSVRDVLVSQAIECIGVLLDEAPELHEAVDRWLCEIIDALDRDRQAKGGTDTQVILLPVCELMRANPSPQLPNAFGKVLQHLEHILISPPSPLDTQLGNLSISRSDLATSPSHPGATPSDKHLPRDESLSAAVASAVPPHQLIWAARCLAGLPQGLWDGKLSEEAMGSLLSGLAHRDDAVHKAVVRLMLKISPDIIQQHFVILVDEIVTASAQEHDTRLPVEHLAIRALEVLEVRSSAVGSTDQATEGIVLEQLAHDIVQVFVAMRGPHEKAIRRREVPQWDEGFSRSLAMYNSWSRTGRLVFTKHLMAFSESRGLSSETALLLASAVCEFASDLDVMYEETSIRVQMIIIDKTFTTSCRELGLVALAALFSRIKPTPTVLLEDLKSLENAWKMYPPGEVLERRLQQIIDLISARRLWQIADPSADQTLSHYYVTLTSVHDAYLLEQQNEQNQAHEDNSDLTARSMVERKGVSASKLRYDAYAAPAKDKIKRKKDVEGYGPMKEDVAKAEVSGYGGVEDDDERPAGEGTALLFDSGEPAEEGDVTNNSSGSRITIGSARSVSDPFQL